ncbi:hypothetical protein [Thermofilum pendens]|uniref:Uncharacterized protein n=1 Tax=Thermofilum pendens (strain DSM 2475 / Hrk 5) TaxID=368408 RepID=A1RYN9_THEPD|nr:hypothetical protein [Thermofilum pendens]ABL78319.1 hypothetical protein Tpen_0918 [Thermofilum pendens Hrk 5]
MARRRGQVRIIEAVLATFMVVAIILLVMSFARPLRSVYVRETSDLRRLAYNLLNNMADNGVFEKTLANLNPSAAQGGGCTLYDLAMMATASLPPGILFRMDVYRVDFDVSAGNTSLVWLGCASNYDTNTTRLVESEPVSYTYVCTGDPDSVRGTALYILLTIGYSG